jgi:thiol-disulfide isomerase/thioredoxin
MRNVLIALAALVLAGAIAVGVRQAGGGANAAPAPPLTRAEVSKPISGAPPELAALHRQVNVMLDGGVRAFDAKLRELRGHPVVVNFWASWCAPCQRELPSFQREAVARGAQVAFLGVNTGDNPAQAAKLAARFPMPYPSFADPRDTIVAGRFHAQGLPVTAFYDARGKLAIVRQGEFPNRQLLADAIQRYALR